MGDCGSEREGRPRPDGSRAGLGPQTAERVDMAAGIDTGKLFRRVSSAGRPWGDGVTEKLVWYVVKEFAAKIGVTKLALHDLR